MNRPEKNEYAQYFENYVSLVGDGEIAEILGRQIEDTLQLLERVGEERASHRYAPDKWSVKEVVGHVIDTERVLAFRALAFARGDTTPLPGFEQDDYARSAGSDGRQLADLAEELRLVRASNLALFTSFDGETGLRRGVADGNPFSVRCVPYIVAGHELHHRAVLEERYL